MRITVITPFFPPDVSPAARYAKTLCTHLATSPEGPVRCVHYGQLPEAVAGVAMVSLPKDRALWRRLLACLYALWHERSADVWIVLNGPSVELPVALWQTFFRGRIIYIVSDSEAATRTTRLSASLHAELRRIATSTLVPDPLLYTPPVRHPLLPPDTATTAAYTAAWQAHVAAILSLCRPKN